MSNRAIDFKKTALAPIIKQVDIELSDHAVTSILEKVHKAPYKFIFSRVGWILGMTG